MSKRPSIACRVRLVPVLLALSLASVTGCSNSRSGQTSDDPLADMRSTACTPEERVQAVYRAWAAAQAGELDIGAVREQFKTSLFLLSSTDAVRLRIVEALLTDGRPEGVADTRSVLRLRLPRETSWPIIQRVADESVKNNWTDMTPALVRSYSRKVSDPPDAERPERAALLALNPGKSIEEIVYDVFVTNRDLGPDASDSTKYLAEKARTDAWDLLGRLDPDGSKRASLLAGDARVSTAPESASPAPGKASPDTMLSDLRAAARDLRAVPITGQELEWVRVLRSPGNTLNETWWKEATAAIGKLSDEQALGLEVRHAEAVRWAATHHPEWLAMSRSALSEELRQRLRGRTYHTRSIENGDFGTATPETIDYWDAKLVWGDFLTMLVIDEALKDPAVISALLDQADKDRGNTRTEQGGALEAAIAAGGGASESLAARFEARDYPPQVGSRSNDNKYVATERMIAGTPRCLAHYHFHAQKEKNLDYAGPSDGDLDYADTYARNCLVLTSVGRGVLGVDYYQRRRVRIDLGEVRIGK
ncbi:MAG: hypothetical protein AB7G11_13830 [Phycisphaerales bacterium]